MALFTILIVVGLFFWLPVTIVLSIMPAPVRPYVPKRLRYRARFKRMQTTMMLVAMATVAKGQHIYTYMNNVPSMMRKESPNANSALSDDKSMGCCFVASDQMVEEMMTFDSDAYTMVIDNACSYCITNDTRHYIDTPEKIDIPVKGIGGKSVSATLKGTVKWSYTNDNGQVHDEYIPNTYYHKHSPYCLYSPQHVAQVANDNFPTKNGTSCTTFADEMELVWDQRTQKKTIKLDKRTNIFMMHSAPNYARFHAFNSVIDEAQAANGIVHDHSTPHVQEMISHIIPFDDDENTETENATPEQNAEATSAHPDLPLVFDLPEPMFARNSSFEPPEDVEIQATSDQAKLLGWHYRLGHLPFKRIQRMAARGDLPAGLATCPIPKCAACLFGKATRRAWRTRAPPNSMTVPPVTAPGSVVSVDQMVSAVPGLIAQMKGFITHQRYNVATVYIDHFSDLSYVYLQKGATVEETVEGKKAFEQYARTHNVRIQHYHADNGIFEAQGFRQAIAVDGQTISYCGVNAHHQNGRAEKKIRDLQEQARTMLLHAQQRWPKAINAHLWPFAVKIANDLANRSPSIKNGISPIETFSQVEVMPAVKHSHTFGAPVYVLDSALQVPGKGLPKWEQRSNIGIYVGTSPRHSRKVALVLNLKTGHVSPQFHVVIDDFFETMRPSAGNVVPASEWQKATGLNKTGALNTSRARYKRPGSSRPTDRVLWNIEDPRQDEGMPEGLRECENAPTEDITDTIETSTEIPASEVLPVDVGLRTRSGRISIPTTRMQESLEQQTAGIVSLVVEWEVYHDESYEIQRQMEQPMAFAATSNPDVMYLDQAMKEADSADFQRAMIKEVASHADNGHWEMVLIASIPKGTKILPSVWAMRRKRKISTGEIYKWKARLNVHGGKQELGINYWETYAPVIAWTTIRMYLILAILNKRTTRQIDFVLAYPQADIECDLYMELPRGIVFEGVTQKTHCLLLRKNLYGQKQAGRVWNQYLHDGLLARGFTQSKVDMCLYFHAKHQVNLLIYTDDGILTGKDDRSIDEVLKLLQQPAGENKEFRPFNITDEGNVTDYLGVKVEQMEDGAIKLSQPHLIQQVIDDLGFNERTKGKETPAKSTERLHRDLHSEPMNEKWHYRSVIGKLNFIEKSTRPDIAYAVHQCARFSNDPKASHAAAVKHIVKYLMTTKDQGIYLRPDKQAFDCWVDADFVGNWNRVNADVDPSTAKSRTGYIINYAGCPVTWASKLQTEVALSTTEAEYNALSTSLRDVIHLMQLLDEAKELGWTTVHKEPLIHCKVFEDNMGTLEMARLPKMRPRTKHLCVRLHHFREHVRTGLIKIQHIATELQIADLLTKPQPKELFIAQRSILMKWEPTDPNHLRACGILSHDVTKTTNSHMTSQRMRVSMTTDRGAMTTEDIDHRTLDLRPTTSSMRTLGSYVASSESTNDGDAAIFQGRIAGVGHRSNNQLRAQNVATEDEKLDRKRNTNKTKQNSLK